jgi:hypothetical protein
LPISGAGGRIVNDIAGAAVGVGDGAGLGPLDPKSRDEHAAREPANASVAPAFNPCSTTPP